MQLSSALQQKCQKEETMERNCRCLSIKHSERVVNVLADHWAALSPTDRLWDFGSASPHKALTSHVAQPSARGGINLHVLSVTGLPDLYTATINHSQTLKTVC